MGLMDAAQTASDAISLALGLLGADLRQKSAENMRRWHELVSSYEKLANSVGQVNLLGDTDDVALLAEIGRYMVDVSCNERVAAEKHRRACSLLATFVQSLVLLRVSLERSIVQSSLLASGAEPANTRHPRGSECAKAPPERGNAVGGSEPSRRAPNGAALALSQNSLDLEVRAAESTGRLFRSESTPELNSPQPFSDEADLIKCAECVLGNGESGHRARHRSPKKSFSFGRSITHLVNSLSRSRLELSEPRENAAGAKGDAGVLADARDVPGVPGASPVATIQSAIRAYVDRQQYRGSKRKRQFLKTQCGREQRFLEHLVFVLKHVYLPTRERITRKHRTKPKAGGYDAEKLETLHSIFAHMFDLVGLHTQILADLKLKLSEWNVNTKIGHIVVEKASQFDVYLKLGENYPRSLDCYFRLDSTDSGFRQLCNLSREKGFPVDAVLSCPFVHLQAWIEAMQDVVQSDSDFGSEAADQRDSLRVLMSIWQVVGTAHDAGQRQIAFGNLRTRITACPINLQEPFRTLVSEHDVSEIVKPGTPKKQRTIFVLSDCVLCCGRGKNVFGDAGTLEYKWHCAADSLQLHGGDMRSFRLVQDCLTLSWTTDEHKFDKVIQCSDTNAKTVLIQNILRAQKGPQSISVARPGPGKEPKRIVQSKSFDNFHMVPSPALPRSRRLEVPKR